jgi:type VI secretion system secreted protein Hcp
MAAVDYFLKLGDIKGESADSKHKCEIDIESWSWGENQSGTMHVAGGGGGGKVSMQDFGFTKKMDSASPVIFKACASGEHYSKAVVTCRKAGKTPQEFLKITMSDVLVSSYHTGGHAASDTIPLDQVSLNFAKIEFSYSPQKADGTLDAAIETKWDIKKNEG